MLKKFLGINVRSDDEEKKDEYHENSFALIIVKLDNLSN